MQSPLTRQYRLWTKNEHNPKENPFTFRFNESAEKRYGHRAALIISRTRLHAGSLAQSRLIPRRPRKLSFRRMLEDFGKFWRQARRGWPGTQCNSRLHFVFAEVSASRDRERG